MKIYTHYRVGLLIGLLSLNILSACVNTRQVMMDSPEQCSDSASFSYPGLKTPLGQAIIHNNLPMVQVLLRNENTDINNTGTELTSMLLALRCKHPEIAKALLKSGHKALNVTDPDPALGNTALHLATGEGYVDVVEALLGTTYNVDVNAKNKRGDTALHLAAGSGRLDVVELLVKRKDVDKNLENSMGETPFELAKKNNHQDCANALFIIKDSMVLDDWVMHDLKVSHFSKKWDLNDLTVSRSSKARMKERVEYWLAKGLHMDAKDTGAYGSTLLMHVAAHDNQPAVGFLIDQGVNVNAQDKDGDTVLHLAAAGSGYLDMVKLLLTCKSIDPSLKNSMGATALDLAEEMGHTECIDAINKFIDSKSLKNK